MEICCILLIINLPPGGVTTTNVVLIGVGKGGVRVLIIKDVFWMQAICIPRFCSVVLLCTFVIDIVICSILFFWLLLLKR